MKFLRKIAHKYLDSYQKERLINFQKEVVHPLVRFASKSARLSSLYFFYGPMEFAREQQSVLRGRTVFYSKSKGRNGNRYVLRRNIHRIEKGLISRPRKPTFALEYIQETVRVYNLMMGCPENTLLIPELNWAAAVLETYFATVEAHPIIDAAKNQFLSISKGVKNTFENPIPIEYFKKPAGHLDFEEFDSFAQKRRSIRWFLAKKVPREAIDKALKVASYSPSACNRQPFEFLIFDEPELVNRVAKLPPGAAGFGDGFPAIALVVGDLAAFFANRDRHIIYIDASLAAMAFIFGLECQGIGTCILNWPDIKGLDTKARSLLQLDVSEKIVMAIAFGYPDPKGLVPFSAKKSIMELGRYNPAIHSK